MRKVYLPEFIHHKDMLDNLWEEAFFPLNGITNISDNRWQDLNSDNFRSPEFIENVDMVSLGCSFTFGLGLSDKNDIWDRQIAKKLNLTYANISGPGKSTIWCINNFFSYVNKYGNPKILLALFPNFTRFEFKSRSSHTVSEKIANSKHLNNDQILKYSLSLPAFHYRNTKYLKKPFIVEDTFPPETAFDISLQYIKMLEAYCNTNNILLIWTTWTTEQENWLEKNINDLGFKNFYPNGSKHWHSYESDGFKDRLCEKYINFFRHDKRGTFYDPKSECNPDHECKNYVDCHQELRLNENFDVATDAHDKFGKHWGIHRHVHMAEFFIDKIYELEKSFAE